MSESQSPSPENNKEEPKVEYNEHTAVLVKDIILCMVRTGQGPAIMSNFKSRQEATMAMVNTNIEIATKIIKLDAMNRKSVIIPAKGGIMGFARKMFSK